MKKCSKGIWQKIEIFVSWLIFFIKTEHFSKKTYQKVKKNLENLRFWKKIAILLKVAKVKNWPRLI